MVRRDTRAVLYALAMTFVLMATLYLGSLDKWLFWSGMAVALTTSAITLRALHYVRPRPAWSPGINVICRPGGWHVQAITHASETVRLPGDIPVTIASTVDCGVVANTDLYAAIMICKGYLDEHGVRYRSPAITLLASERVPARERVMAMNAAAELGWPFVADYEINLTVLGNEE